MTTATQVEKTENNTRTAAGERPVMHVCGLNHVRAQVGLREQYALSPDQCRELMTRIKTEGVARQCIVLSTCNRTEIYAWGAAENLEHRLRAIFIALGGDGVASDGPPPLYQYQGHEALRHLLAVAAGLDSMLLGENQIKQQLLQAYEASKHADCAGAELHRAMKTAFTSAKRIKTETRLNHGTLCVGMAAVFQGEQRLGGLAGKTCLIIGAGKIGRLSARAIAERAPGRLLIVNRTVEKARELSQLVNGEAFGLDSLDELLPQADLIIGAVRSAEQVLSREHYAQLRARADSPARVCIGDVAVPRIFDPDLAQIDGVSFFNIEAMEEIVENNRRQRAAVAGQAWKIVEEECEKFRAAQLMHELGPRIRRLQASFDAIFNEERPNFGEARDLIGLDRIEGACQRIKQRLLHEAIQQLKAEHLAA